MAQKFTVPITVKQLSSAGSDALTVYVDADTYSRLKIEAGGRITWGPGSGLGDVNLYRDSADVLKTDDTFKAPALYVDNIEIDPTGAVTNDVLVFNGSKFTAASVALGGGGGASLTVSDTAPISPTEGDLCFNSSNAKTYVYYDSTWVEVGASGGVAELDDIGDVDVPSPSIGDYLQWDGSAWTSGSVVAISSIDDISDVVITDPETYQTLVYDGSAWINEYPTTVSLVNNAEATTLQVGEAVYLYGGTGNHASVKRADNDGDATSAKTVGLVAAAIPAGGNGPVVTRGYVSGIDLSVGYSEGQTLYLGENGGFTTTKPHAPEHLVYIGVVVRATNNGIIYVAAQNGYELDEIHDVDLITTPPVSGDFLKYNGSLWVNDAINLGTDTVGNYLASISGGTGIDVNFSAGDGVGASVSLNATLNDLSDVSTVGASAGNVLAFNGSSWTAASAAAGGASVTVSETAPVSPTTGDLWFESDTSRTYVYYDSFWIEIGGVAPGATVSDTAPSSPVTGQVWFNSLNGGTYVYYSSAWAEVGAVPVNNLLNLLDAKGDLFVGSADNTAAKLSVGTTGQVLVVDPSATYGVKWAAIPPSGGLSTSTEGAIMTMAIGA